MTDKNGSNDSKQESVPRPGAALRRIVKRFWNGEEDSATYKRIFHLTWPAFIELLLAAMFGLVDTAMVGRLSPAAISGVGITNQPINLLIGVFAAVNVGTTTLVSWNIGAGNNKKAGFVGRQAILLNFVLSLVMMTIGVLATPAIMEFMSNDPIAVEHGKVYMRIICWSLPFQAVTMSITAAMRGCGQTRIPMFYNVAANFIDIFLNYGMIYGAFGFPAMGVAGAAWSTTIVRIGACIAAVCILFFWKESPVRLRLRDNWLPHFATMKDLFAIGLPAAGEQFVIQTGLMMYQKIITGLGTNAHAAHQTAAGINGMAWSISQAFSVCTSALVGQCVGGNDYDQAERYARFTRRLARLFTAVVAVLFIIFARPLVGLFTNEEAVITIAIPVFWIVAIVQYVQSSLMSTSGALRGAGDTMYPLYASIFGIWIFRIALAYLFVNVFRWGLNGAWFSFFIDMCIRSYIIKRRFDSGKWRDMKNKKNGIDDDMDADAAVM